MRSLFLFLVRAAFAAAVLAAPPASSASRNVLVFGDSLSAAYGIAPKQGWVTLLAERIARAGLPWQVVNASVSGETTAGGLRRLPEDLKRHQPSVALIELGANDALRGQPVTAIRSNLEQMIRLVRAAHAEPVLVGIMIPPNYGIDYAAEFRDVFADVARRNKVALVPFLLEGLVDKPEMFQADQLHPTAAAQPRIVDNVWPTLAPLLQHKSP
jgi:acyl-CoA thioesterase-1